MPWISNPTNDPSYPYGYITKKRPFKEQRYRLPPYYFNKGYQFYQHHQHLWLREIKDQYKRLGTKFNPFKNPDDYRTPIYYSYDEFLAKAKKYALRRRKAIKDRIASNRNAAIRRRIERNKQRALQNRKLIVAYNRNKYNI